MTSGQVFGLGTAPSACYPCVCLGRVYYSTAEIRTLTTETDRTSSFLTKTSRTVHICNPCSFINQTGSLAYSLLYVYIIQDVFLCHHTQELHSIPAFSGPHCIHSLLPYQQQLSLIYANSIQIQLLYSDSFVSCVNKQ